MFKKDKISKNIPWLELDISLSGEGGPAPKTLTRLKTKIVQFLIPCLRHLAQNYTLFKKFAKKKYPVSDKVIKIDALFKTKIPKKKNLTGRTSPLSPSKGVPSRIYLQLFSETPVPAV